VEGVFLVSGSCKNCFLAFQKKEENFLFFTTNKRSKAGLRSTFQIASFPYGNAENMFYNFVVFFLP
jgi:hypothetical protein